MGTGLLVGAAAACSPSDPAIRPAADSTPSPGGSGAAAGSATPRPVPPVSAAVTAEQVLADGARSALTGSGLTRTELTGRQRALLQLMARTHDERVAALTADNPGARPAPAATASPAPSPSPTPGPVPDAGATLARLERLERRAATRSRTAALAGTGRVALLQGSMAVASTGFADALAADDPPPSAAVAAHVPVTLLSDTEAVAAVVDALHAVVWGYQLALGRLPGSGRPYARAAAGLRGHRILQDRLVEQLVRAGAEVPPAQPAYDPSPEVRDAASAALLLRRLESRLQPFLGSWLAAAGTAGDRTLAYDALAAAAATARSWGAPLSAWPGWSD